MRAWPLLLMAMILASACRRPSPSTSEQKATENAAPSAVAPVAPVAPGVDVRERGHHVLGLYFMRDPGAAALATFQREAKTTRFQVIAKKGTAQRSDPDTVYMAAPELADAPPPSADQLEFFGRGLSPADKAQAVKVAAVRVIAFSLRDPLGVREADQLVERVAAATGAYVFDTATRELFTLPAWRSLRISAWNGERPIVERHVAVHAYRDGAAYRAVSLGMEKFGVPDLAVNGMRGEDLQRVDALVRLTLQSMVDQGKTTATVATKTGDVTVHLVSGHPADGDAENRLFELGDPINPLLDRLGDAEDLRGVREDDAEIAAAVAQVQTRVPALSRRFAAGLGATGHLRVKASFEHEAMWIEVVTWDKGEVRGSLVDHPQLATKLVAGEIVQIREAEILDYKLTGVPVPEGPFLQEILERKTPKRSP